LIFRCFAPTDIKNCGWNLGISKAGASIRGESMKILARILKWTSALVVLVVAALFGWLTFAPPELIRVGSAYSAKIVCSNVFLAGRSADEVLDADVQAPGHPLLRLMRVDVDMDERAVTAGLLGMFGKSIAIEREGLGCTSVPDGNIDAARAVRLETTRSAQVADAAWPAGNRVEALQDAALGRILNDETLTGPGMRAVLVVHQGRIVGERYADGFSAQTPLLGWSMTKTVNAAIIGTLVKAGKMNVDAAALLPAWQNDERKQITLGDLMAMSSGLAFNEDYGDVTDVTRMLFLEPDMAAFAASKALAGGIGKQWSYSSGTAVILSALWQQAAGGDALAWPGQSLFVPLGMTSAVLETDEKGTFAGSSYLYATARDWARFGQLLLQDGRWNGQDILPQGFVAWMREPAPASNGEYGRGQVWLRGPAGGVEEKDAAPAEPLPTDAYWLIGHDGQTMVIVPSKKIIVLRMGLTPSKTGYRPQGLAAAVVKTLDR
jgi:CubicO group peptidase (beta-lactamase class C family)